MKPLSIKLLSVAVLAFGTLGAVSAAHARSDVHFSIGFQAPAYVSPAPVYVEHAPVYVQPRHVYVPPQPVYVAPQVEYRYDRHDGYRYDRHDGRRWQERRHARAYGPYGDLDRDGIRNEYDRDRDGDGVRNRYDRVPNNPYRY